MQEVRRRDAFLPAEPTEVGRFMLQVALLQAREGDVIEIYLPSAVEQAEQVVERSRPIEVTTISNTINEV